jgi:DUF4097 and DUF4098 domain-containing protein YvlB
MSVRRSAGAIFWGLTLVALGGVLLAYNFGYPIHIWTYVARYWPALLIGWGLLKFVDFFRFRHAGDNRPLFSGGEVALLILLILAGSAMTTAANVSPGIGNIFDFNFDWDFGGNTYTFDQHLEQQDVMPGSAIQIVNAYGDVEVRPAETDRILVDVKKTIRANDGDEASKVEQDFTFAIHNDGGSYRIVSNRDEPGFHNGPRQRLRSSLVVQLPRRSTLNMDNRNGRIFVQDLTGNQNLTNRYGEVEVRNVTGQVQIDNRNGSVTVQDVSEAVVINNRYANTTAKSLGGDLQIDTKNGSVDVGDVKGNVTISNSYAPISVQNVNGNLTINGRNNSVDVQHVDGNINADSSYQNVDIKDARGAVTVTTRNGDMTLSLERPPQKDISVTAKYGTVTLELPSGSSFEIDARTEYGQVYSEFDSVRTEESHRERSLTGHSGQAGPRINVSLKNGDIRLNKRG